MNLTEQIKSFQIVRKNNEFKAQSYCNAAIRNWKGIESVRKDFCYSLFLCLRRFISCFTELITNCEVLSLLFFTKSISAITSYGKRTSMRFDLLLCLPVAILIKMVCHLCQKYTVKRINKIVLTCRYTLFYSVVTPICFRGVKLTITQRASSSMGYLTKPLNGVMIMANRYDNAFLHPKQIKLFKFYDFSTNQIIETIAITEQLARDNLGKPFLIFVARKLICPMTQQINMLGGIEDA